jgi:hypothetical protein
MLEVFIVIALVIIFILFKLVFPQLLIRWALKPVIARFRERQALDPQRARSPEALGLAPLPFAERMMNFKDYKPKALEALIHRQIVLSTEDGKLYLSEARLAGSPIGRQMPHLVQDAPCRDDFSESTSGNQDEP